MADSASKLDPAGAHGNIPYLCQEGTQFNIKA